ncbi:MAG: ABC transporter ATP-binding protein [bacterium]
MQPILITSGLFKSFSSGLGGRLEILKGIDLVIRRGEMLAIVGPSGVGKSTLLHILGALDRPTQGNIEVDGISIFDYSDKHLATFRNREIGFVFQFHHLLEEFNALENVLMPALISGFKISKVRERAMGILSRVGLGDRWSHRPGELSGGEQQRVAVARALMNEPKLILADEPSGNLDSASAGELHDLLWQLTRKEGRTIIVVTHNLQLASLADRIIRIDDGRIKEERTNGRR